MRIVSTPTPTWSRRQAIRAGLAAAGLGLAAAIGARISSPPIAQTQLAEAARQRPLTRNDRVIWSYQEIVRDSPSNADARAILAGAYIQKARETGDPSFYTKAEQLVAQALAIDPQHIDGLIAKGTLELARHQFRAALATGERARQIAPLVIAIYGVIADAQIELGMYAEATATVQSMVDRRPDLSSYSRVSYIRELYGDLPGAAEAMARAVAAGGGASEHTEWARVQLGQLFFAQGDLDEAERHFLESLQRLPEYVFAIAGLARVLAARGQVPEAAAAYQDAIARMPLPEFVIALGELHESSGQPQEAVRQYQLVRAMQQLFAANGVATDMELALFEADHGSDPAAAVAMARSAYQQRPGIKGADTLAWALYRQGATREAEPLIAEALRLGTQDATLLFHAGMIALAAGRRADARAYLHRALTLNPSFSPLHAPIARQALATIPAG
jgi:tetratricopeptide (TPR) repeat protein